MRSFVASFALPLVLLAAAAHAQTAFYAAATPHGDDAATQARRLRNVDAASVQVARESESIGWNLYRYETSLAAAPYLFGKDVAAAERNGCAGSFVSRENGWRVRFYARDGDGFRPLGDVLFADSSEARVEYGQSLRPFSTKELALIRAQEAVKAQGSTICDDPSPIIAMPALIGDAIWVYQLRAPHFNQRIPEGQHTRYVFSADGTQQTAKRDFARACVFRDSETRGNQEIVSLSHTLDSVPTEMHVYLTLRYRKPLFIATLQNNMYWVVSNGAIQVDR